MFFALAPNASLVEGAIIKGRSFLRCALAAIVTEVSVIPLANLPKVLPVQGAITKTSSNAFGPIGSAFLIVSIIYVVVALA